MNNVDLVTGNMKRDFAKWLEAQPGKVSMYQAYRAGREALEAWKAEAMEVLRAVAEDGELFGHPDKYQITARRLVEKEDGRHG